MDPAAGRPVVTVVQHDDDVPLDQFAGWLDGLELRVVRAWAGQAVPTDPDLVGDGLIVLGGQMDAYADDVAPWLSATRALLAAAAGAGVPTLGICLGAQLLAVAGGGRVQVAAPAGREAGITEIRWHDAAAGDPVLGTLAAAGRRTPMPSMHADAVVELPPGADWLASSERYPYQAFRLGSAWGVQFHPEASAALLRAWAREHDDLDAAAVGGDYAAREPEISTAGRAIAEGFAAVVHARAQRTNPRERSPDETFHPR
jgi:GMP synthase (glutamine-hydrolysing)